MNIRKIEQTTACSFALCFIYCNLFVCGLKSIVLQKLIVASQLPSQPANRRAVGGQSAPPSQLLPLDTTSLRRERFSRNLNNFPLVKWHNSGVEGSVWSGGCYSLRSSVWLNLGALLSVSMQHTLRSSTFSSAKSLNWITWPACCWSIRHACCTSWKWVHCRCAPPQNPYGDWFAGWLCLQQSSREVLLRVLQQHPNWYVMKILLQHQSAKVSCEKRYLAY